MQGGTFGKVLLSSMGGAIGGAVNNWAWQSKYILNEMVALEEEIWQGLGIPYQKLNICSGDL